jgi:hypothetical protein
VEQWLAAIAAADVEALDRLVEPIGLAVLAGVENGLRSDELVALLESGFTPALANEYWGSFRNDFEAIRGLSVAALIVGAESTIESRPDSVAVDVAGPESVGFVLLRRSSNSGWQIDTAATMGPALVGPLGNYLLSALNGANAEVIAAAYREGILPGLDSAVSKNPGNTDLAFETEYIRQLLGD